MTEATEQDDQQKSKREPKTRRTGQIIRRGDNRFIVRIYLGVDSLTQKRLYHNHTVRGTRKDADKYLTAKLRELDLGVFVKPTTKTLGQYFDEWLIGKRMEVTAHSAAGYVSLFETHVRKPLGNERLTMLQADAIQEIYRWMLAEKASARTVQHVHRVLNTVLREAVSAGYLLRNPADGVKLPKIEKKEQRHFSQDEATRFLAAYATMRQGLAFELALATGLRPQEYLALKWADVDFERNTLRIVRALERYKKEWRFKEPKTAKSRRSVLLPAPLMNKLRLHRKAQLEQQLKLGSLWQKNELVFCNDEGHPLDQRSINDLYLTPVWG